MYDFKEILRVGISTIKKKEKVNEKLSKQQILYSIYQSHYFGPIRLTDWRNLKFRIN